jgi:hypothetical protein
VTIRSRSLDGSLLPPSLGNYFATMQAIVR